MFPKVQAPCKLSGHHDKVSRNHETWHLGLAEPWTSTIFINHLCVWMVCVIQTAPLSNYRHVKDLKKESPIMLELLVQVYQHSSGTCYFHYHCTWWRHTFLWNTGTLLPDYTVLFTNMTAITITSAMRNSKLIQITKKIYVWKAPDLFVHIRLETVIWKCQEVNRSNLQET